MDDEIYNIMAIETMLHHNININISQVCDHCFNGNQALHAVIENVKKHSFCEYNLILIDCNMPFMDGYDAT